MHTPPNAHATLVEVRPAPRGTRGGATTEERDASPGGATTAEQKPLGVSLSDPKRLVTAIAGALRTLRGQALTPTVTRILAEMVRIEVPWMSLDAIGEMVTPAIAAGTVMDEERVMERARNIAVVALYGGGR